MIKMAVDIELMKITVFLKNGHVYTDMDVPESYLNDGVLSFWLDNTTLVNFPLVEVERWYLIFTDSKMGYS